MIEKFNKKITDSSDDAERVNNCVGLARTKLATMGNNDAEFDRINQIQEAFSTGQIGADEAIEEIASIPNLKQEGVF